MPSQYKYALDSSVVESLLLLPRRHASTLTSHFRHLAENPFEKGDAFLHDSSGREIQKKRFGHWILFYWPDHAVKELRIIGIRAVK